MSRIEFHKRLTELTTSPDTAQEFLHEADWIVEQLLCAAQAVAKFKGELHDAVMRRAS